MSKIKYIDEVEIKNKRVLLRADFDVSLNVNNTIADDYRIKQNLPTINLLLNNKNRLICVAKLNRPVVKDVRHSLKPIVDRLKLYFPRNKVTLVDDFLTCNQNIFKYQPPGEILVLENIRFYPEEKDYSTLFAKKLSSLADVYVNDAFAMCHRSDTSIVGPPRFIPSYAGLLIKNEVESILKTISSPKKPIVAIIGGAKISSKIGLIHRLTQTVDYLVIGGGLANVFLCAQGKNVGESYCEYEAVEEARKLLALSKKNRAFIVLPADVIVAAHKDSRMSQVVSIENIPVNESIYDIGPQTQAQIGGIIAKAKTIIWNGPVGYFENPKFRQGTDFIYYSITQNGEALSLVGGGDTLAAISKKEYLDKITHISTGGGAMLEFIEKGTLQGIEALKQ